MTPIFRLLLARFFYLWGSAHRHFGIRAVFRPEHERAVRFFTRAYALDPGLHHALLDRAILYWREMGRLEEALADFDRLLAEEPQFGPALLNRALVAQEMGRYRAALADIEAYLALPGEDQAYQDVATRLAALLRQVVQEQGG